MKKMVPLICAVLLMLSACGADNAQNVSTTVPTMQPSVSYDFTFNMGEYAHFGHIFEEKTQEQWEQMGQYTLLLTGMDTPVVVQMDGMTVLSVSAYGHTAQTDISPFQGDTPANIQSTRGAVVVNESLDYEGSTWLLTADGVHEFHPVGDISTQIFAEMDDTLCYRTYWGEYDTSFEQWDTAPLDLCTSRDHFLYEFGTATIVDGQVIFKAEETVTVSDVYDLDDMFAAVKAEGMYEEFDSVDQLLAFNAQK